MDGWTDDGLLSGMGKKNMQKSKGNGNARGNRQQKNRRDLHLLLGCGNALLRRGEARWVPPKLAWGGDPPALHRP